MENRDVKKHGKKLAYYAKLTGIFLLSAAVLAAGSAVVRVNCHNAVSSTQMTLFNVEKNGDEVVITFMDKEYRI